MQILTEEDSIFWFNIFGWQLTEYQALKMVYTRRKSRPYDNPESPPIIQHEINIPEVPTPSRTVFAPENNELLAQRVVQDAHGLEG